MGASRWLLHDGPKGTTSGWERDEPDDTPPPPPPDRAARARVEDVSGRPLNDVELDAYDVLPRELARTVRVHRIRGLPGGYAGMTVGRHVLVARDVEPDGSSPLLAHELVHVRQWADQGPVGFSARYLASFGRGLAAHRRWNPAYRDIEAEREARRETTDWLRRRARAEAERQAAETGGEEGGEPAPDPGGPAV